MTKILLSVFLLSFMTLDAEACKPAPLAECHKMNVKVDPERFSDLKKLVIFYQELLSRKLTEPKNASSCFNNRFASVYSEAFHKHLKEKQGRTCIEQVNQVKSAINNLIDKNSEENLSVLKKHDKKHLKKEAKKVRIALMVLP